MANLKVACLRKGVVVGRASHALNELYIEHEVLDSPDLDMSRGALDELKGTLRPLKKNFKTSVEEVRLIEAGVKNVSKLLRGKPKKEALDATKKELREIRRNFRKAVQKGFTECGGSSMSTYDINHFTNDNAFYTDTHPDVKIE
jgi:hypothetical protein